jgi:predicted TIM-barrel fold metal-dependent hydrolase
MFDHVAHAEPRMPGTDPKFAELLRILKMNSNPGSTSTASTSFQKPARQNTRTWSMSFRRLSPTVRQYRLGQHWPHGGVSVPMPDDGDLLDFLFTAVPDEKTRNAILADNPAKLYGWSA